MRRWWVTRDCLYHRDTSQYPVARITRSCRSRKKGNGVYRSFWERCSISSDHTTIHTWSWAHTKRENANRRIDSHLSCNIVSISPISTSSFCGIIEINMPTSLSGPCNCRRGRWERHYPSIISSIRIFDINLFCECTKSTLCRLTICRLKFWSHVHHGACNG